MKLYGRRCSIVVVLFLIVTIAFGAPSYANEFKVGFAKRDISPQKPVPMWGYGARHALLSQGVRDPLFAKGIVIDDGAKKIAIVGMDIGRGPTQEMMDAIRKAVKEAAGVEFLMIAGSHTHHGPVIELKDEPGKGKGKFDNAVAYSKELPQTLIALIKEAAANVQPAKIGWTSEQVDLNHNRHTKIEPKPVDHELAVVRFDDLAGKPIAILVNFAAHPTNLDEMELKFSSEYPGYMQNTVEAGMGTNCMFMQGASGDLSPDKHGLSMEDYGKAMGEKVIAMAGAIQTAVPAKPSVQGIEDDFAYQSRVDFSNPFIRGVYGQGFFPELVAMLDEMPNNTVHPHLATVLLNSNLALVGGSGEFFCQHSIRLKERVRGAKTLFFGYCDGHHMYFPTIEATSEGGYGCDPLVSWVSLGAGEEIMNRALINIYTLMGKYEQQKGIGVAGSAALSEK